MICSSSIPKIYKYASKTILDFIHNDFWRFMFKVNDILGHIFVKCLHYLYRYVKRLSIVKINFVLKK